MNFFTKFGCAASLIGIAACSPHPTPRIAPAPQPGTWDQGPLRLADTAPGLVPTQDQAIADLRRSFPNFEGLIFTQSPSRLEGREGEDRSRIMRLTPDGNLQSLTNEFVQAADPDLSFDGERMLFAGKKSQKDFWQIYEMNVDGTQLHQITHEPFDSRHPIYLSTLYVITSEEPWHQIAFQGNRPGQVPALFSCRQDGSALRQLTFNPYGAQDPFLLRDGRIAFSGGTHGAKLASVPHSHLFHLHSDGTDVALLGAGGGSFQRSPVETQDHWMLFVETTSPEKESGSLAAISLRRPFQSYRPLSQEHDGLFQTPAPLPNGEVLVSHQKKEGFQTFGLYRLNLATGQLARLWDDPAFHETQPRWLEAREVPDGRSSVINEAVATGELYALSVFTTDLPPETFNPRQATHLRVVEGRTQGQKIQMHLLGVVPLKKDGSFNVRVPANLPLQLHLLDVQGNVLRSCEWLWVKNKEPRGCIGCHEDGERVPENVMAEALREESIELLPPPTQRPLITDEARRVFFQHLHESSNN